MDSRTMLVGDLMLGLLFNTNYNTYSIELQIEPAQDNDDNTIGEEGDEHEDGHDEAIDRQNNIQGAHPG